MPDNVVANPGAGGVTLATDEIAGVHHPYSKLEWGPADTANITDDASGKRLPVKIGDGLGAASVVAGQISVGATEAALTSAVARRFRIRAFLANVDVIYLGPTGVSAANGFPLWPGDVTPPLELSNLNVVHAIAASAGDKLAYLGEV